MCTEADRCSLQHALSLRSAERNTIQLADGTYALTQPVIVSSVPDATIVGSRGAIFEYSGVGTAAEVTGGATLELRGVTFRRAVGCLNGTLRVRAVAFNTPGSDARPWISVSGCVAEVSDSVLWDSVDSGIVLAGGGDLSVTGTTIERSAKHGIEASAGMLSVKTSTITKSNQLGITGNGARVVVQRSVVSFNRLGGIRSTNGSFDVVNNYVFRNGDPGQSTFGGMHLDAATTGSRVVHNTVMYNDCDVNVTPPLSGGIYCRIGPIGTAYGNMIAQNYRGNTSLQNAQTGGTCDFSNSLVAENPLAPVNFGCLSGSDMCRLAGGTGPAIDKGMPLGVPDDFDGQPRSDGKPDIGADEFHPN